MSAATGARRGILLGIPQHIGIRFTIAVHFIPSGARFNLGRHHFASVLSFYGAVVTLWRPPIVSHGGGGYVQGCIWSQGMECLCLLTADVSLPVNILLETFLLIKWKSEYLRL